MQRLREIVTQRLGAVGLGEWASRRVDELSKGMQQKLQFITATIADPDLLILDEPFSGLDPVNLEALMQQIRSMREEGKTILLSTHILQEVTAVAERVLLIHNGRLVFDGLPADLQKDAPLDETFYKLTDFGRAAASAQGEGGAA